MSRALSGAAGVDIKSYSVNDLVLAVRGSDDTWQLSDKAQRVAELGVRVALKIMALSVLGAKAGAIVLPSGARLVYALEVPAQPAAADQAAPGPDQPAPDVAAESPPAPPRRAARTKGGRR